MPRSKQQNEQIRRQRMEQILKAALKVYAEKGYAAAEIGDIAEQAGMARGLVYYYYKDKLSLFRELFNYMTTKAKQHVQTSLAKEGPVLVLLERYISSTFHSMLEESEYVLFFMRMGHDMKIIFTEEELARMKNWHVEYLQVFAETLQRGMQSGEIRTMSPWLLAAQFWGAVSHAMGYFRERSRVMRNEGKSIEEVRQSIAQDVDDAIAACMAIVRRDAAHQS